MERDPNREETRQALRAPVVFLLLALLVGLAYWNSLDNGFSFDDESLVEKNDLIFTLDNLPRLFTTDYWAGARDPRVGSDIKTGRYRPFVLLTFALQYRWGRLDPVPYHAVNVALHLGVSWVLYLLALRIGLTALGATAAAILFAVHPIHSEPVNMLVGRAELLMALGVLAGLLWAIQGRQWLSLAAFTGALLSKEQAAVLPVLLILYHYCFDSQLPSLASRSGLAVLLRRYAWYGLVLGLYLITRAAILGKVVMTPVRFIEDPVSYLPWYSWLLTVIKAAGLYIWLSLWPTHLSSDYSYDSLPPATSLLDTAVLFAMLAWGLLFGIAWWSLARGSRRAAFLALFTIVTFLPGSNLLFPVGTPMAERVFYLPSAGLCLLAGLVYQWATMSAGRRRGRGTLRLILPIAVAVLCVAMTIRTVNRNRDWINSESAALSILRVFPNNAKAHAYLGQAAVTRKDWEAALRHYEETLRIYPDFETEPAMAANLGLALVETGRTEEGIKKIQHAVSIEPTWSELQRLLGIAYAKALRYADAEKAFRQAILLNPDNRHAHFGLSYIYLEQGEYESALQEAEAAIRLRPDFMEPHYIRGRALEALGRDSSAIEEYARVMTFYQAPGDVAERFYRLRAAHQGRG